MRIVRLIPAWAGKTSPGACRSSPRPAHPRVGGENTSGKHLWGTWLGSSPRGRGKLGVTVRNEGGERLIPAWAGKTSHIAYPSAACAAHPRVGGENAWIDVVPSFRGGSSPRGRGKLRRHTRRKAPTRLIPAWAGKTSSRDVMMPGSAAHPRVGGENGSARRRSVAGSGSSPRGRGKRLLMVHLLDLQRLIPAWAGKTPGAARRWMEPTAHPRVGGENGVIDMVAQDHAGSSPRGRGKRHRLPRPRLLPRLIPAWAGKTGGGGVSTELESAHPRVGGENVAWATVGAFGTGSSPRGRGKREGIPPLVKW